MLTKEQIENNKIEFLALLRTINREGARIEELIEKLESSDFFTAPSSIKYHGAYEGGLCDHSLNVYYNMMHLLTYKAPVLGIDPEQLQESVLITALLHDISKMNLYTVTSKNVKVYSPDGNKQDAMGTFYWDTEIGYAIREAKDRLVYGSHEQNSDFIIRHFIPLSIEEGTAILHHMGGMSWDSAKDNITEVYGKYTLAVLLHLADMLATYVDEKEQYE